VDEGARCRPDAGTDPSEEKHVELWLPLACAAARDVAIHSAGGCADEGAGQNRMPADPASLRIVVLHSRGSRERNRIHCESCRFALDRATERARPNDGGLDLRGGRDVRDRLRAEGRNVRNDTDCSGGDDPDQDGGLPKHLCPVIGSTVKRRQMRAVRDLYPIGFRTIFARRPCETRANAISRIRAVLF